MAKRKAKKKSKKNTKQKKINHNNFYELNNNVMFSSVFGGDNSLVNLNYLRSMLLGVSNDPVVKILNPFRIAQHVADKGIILDIKSETASGELFNIEMQNYASKVFSDRHVYYASANFYKQIESGDDYEDLKKVTSAVLLNERVTGKFRSKVKLRDDEWFEVYTDILNLWAFELPCLDQLELGIERYYLVLILHGFAIKHKNSARTRYKELLDEVKDYPDLVRIVKKIIELNLDREVYKVMTQEQIERVERYFWRKDGVIEGRELGLREGIEQGVQQGTQQAMIQTVINAHEAGYSIDDIVRITKLSSEEVVKIVDC